MTRGVSCVVCVFDSFAEKTLKIEDCVAHFTRTHLVESQTPQKWSISGFWTLDGNGGEEVHREGTSFS